MKNITKILIFDMDGVVLDSEPLHQKAREIMYKKYAVHIDSDFPDPVGKSSSGYWRWIKERCGRTWEPLQMEQEQYKLVLKQVQEDKISETQNLRMMLQWSKKNNLKIGLASSSSRMLVDGILNALQLKSFFDCTISGDEVDRKKPEPDVYKAVLKSMKIRPEEAIAIEDSSTGIRAAKMAGIRCLAYRNPSSGNQNLSEADSIIINMAEISDFILQRFSCQGKKFLVI